MVVCSMEVAVAWLLYPDWGVAPLAIIVYARIFHVSEYTGESRVMYGVV